MAEGPIDVKHGVTHFTFDFPPGTEVVDPSGREENIHYPMPSDDPADPLNWSPQWKLLTFSTLMMYVFWVSFPYIGVTSMYAPLIIEFGFSVDSISAFVAWSGFMSGIGNIFWVPVACRFGRRPILLLSILGCTAASIWFGTTSHTYRSFLWSRIVLGFFMSPVECFAPMQIADLFFTADRSKMHAWFFINLLVSTNVGGALSGAFADSKAGWRAYFYFNAAMLAATFFLMVFCLPETSFRRSAALGRGVHDSTMDEDLDEKNPTTTEKSSEQQATLQLVGKAPPYNFSNAAVGMTNIPSIIGTITGCLFWGWLSDWDLARRTRNNGGIREPEMRLWLITPGVIIGTIGIVVYAVGAQRGWSWPIILIIGNTLNFFGLIAPLICGLSYSIDAYNRLAAEIGLLLAVFGNAWIFGVGYFVNNLLATRGYTTGLMFLMIPVWGMTVVTIVYLFVGKSARRLTMNHSLLR
ncbi:major facilitator superfamily domain-containing protein [Mycena filopes]|nr:major facilitator superfamily domain-containing protein [Mycena filopes]